MSSSTIELQRIFSEDALAAYLAAIVESSDDAIISKSLSGTITTWNASAERIFGFTATEAVGKNICIIIPFEHMDDEYLILDRLKRGERIDHFETIRHTKSGKLLDVSVTISPIRDRTGKVIGASKIARDISQTKCAERIVHLAAIVESAGDAIISVDPNGKITSWNHSAERLFGFTSREAIGNSLSLIVPGVSTGDQGARLDDSERFRCMETMRRTKDGRLIETSIMVSRVPGRDGGRAGVSEIIRDPCRLS